MSSKVINNLNVDSTNQTARTEQSTMGDINIQQTKVDSPLPETPQKVDQNKGLEKRNQIKQESSVKATETPTETPKTNALGRTFSVSNKKLDIPNSLIPNTERVPRGGQFRNISINNGNYANQNSAQTPFGGTGRLSSINDSSLEERSSKN